MKYGWKIDAIKILKKVILQNPSKWEYHMQMDNITGINAYGY